MNIFRVFLLLIFSFGAAASESLPSYLADPESVDPKFPPAMWSGAIDSHGDPVNAIVYLANGKGPHPTVILLHGFPGNEKNLDLAQAIRRVGWNVVFFHYRGSWGSGGEYSISNANEDVSQAIQFVRKPEVVSGLRIDPRRIALIGHSFGGFYALYGAVNNKGIACASAISAVDLGAAAKLSMAEETPFRPQLSEQQILKGFNPDEAIKDIFANQDNYHLQSFGERLRGIPTLIVIPDGDGEWGVKSQTAIADAYREAGVDVSFNLVEGADHSFAARRIKLMEIVTSWLNESCLPSLKLISQGH